MKDVPGERFKSISQCVQAGQAPNDGHCEVLIRVKRHSWVVQDHDKTWAKLMSDKEFKETYQTITEHI